MTITKQLEKLLGHEMSGTGFGEFVYGLIRFQHPAHVLVHFENPVNGATVAFIGQALKDNKSGGASVIGGDLRGMLNKLGLGMQVLPVPADYSVPLQYDLDLLVVDSEAAFDEFSGRIKPGGYAIRPAGERGVDMIELPENMILWRG